MTENSPSRAIRQPSPLQHGNHQHDDECNDAIMDECEETVQSTGFACDAFGLPPSSPGNWNFAPDDWQDEVCASLQETITPLQAYRVILTPTADPYFLIPEMVVDTHGPFPIDMVAADEGEPLIISCTTDPPEPAPLETYTALSRYGCARQPASFSVEGTDSYTDSFFAFLSIRERNHAISQYLVH